MLSGLSLSGTAVAASPAEVVAASAAQTQVQAVPACPVRAAVVRASHRIERTTPVLPAAVAMPASCGVIIGADRARE
ncbi:MAG: hypothetical protein RIS94_3251 [Pseudomonadota bacterium]